MPEPLYQRLPQTQAAFANKWQELGPIVAPLPPHLRNTILNFDLQRVQRGQQPVSKEQTAFALLSAIRGEAVTKPPEKGFLESLRDDVAAIVTTIPRIPGALVEEVRDLPSIPEHLAESQGNIVERLATAPGIRMVPGAYVAGNVAAGTPGELLKHPLFTALDVLPYASKAAKLTPVGKESMRAVEAGEIPRISPLRAVATRKLAKGGDGLEPNMLGEFGLSALRTRPGQLLRQTFGPGAREVTRMEAIQSRTVEELRQPGGLSDVGTPDQELISQITRQSQTLATKHSIPPERVVQLTRLVQRQPQLISTLSTNELAFINEARELGSRYAHFNVERGFLSEYGGEIYEVPVARRINRAEERLSSAITNLDPSLTNLERAVITPEISELQTLISEGKYVSASKHMSRLVQGEHKFVGLRDSQVINLRTRLRSVAAAEKRIERIKSRNVPSRFVPLVQEGVATRQKGRYITSSMSADDAARIAASIESGAYYNIPGFDEHLLRKDQRAVAQTWQRMKDEGLDPVYVHHVTPEKAMQIEYPHVLEVALKESQLKERMLDMAPTVDDITVGLTHQGVEILSRLGSEEYIASIIERFGAQEAELFARYSAAGQRMAELDPRLDIRASTYRLLKEEWVPYNPFAKGVNWKSNRLTALDPEHVWLPRHIAETLDRIAAPKQYKLAGLLDPVMGVFRTAILPLSARWHVYNILGGAGMLVGRTGPEVFKYLNNARQLLKEGQTTLDGTTISLPKEMRVAQGSMMRTHMELNFLSGRSMGRLWNEIQDHFGKVGRPFGKFVQGSFKLNSYFDDLYKSMAYLYGYDKKLAKGASRDASVRAGMELSRKVLQQWTDLTPIERSILRYVFPFYGFMQHILRYTFQYPIDHPVRASIAASFGRAELEDLGTGLPQSFLSSYFFGDTDENGMVSAINLQGMNPFKDVANYMTLSGFVKSSNPIAATVLQQLGIDISTGEAELYPNLTYDANTGRLQVKQPGFLSSLAQNILPQSRILFELTNHSSEFKQLLRANPDAAMRLLASQAGLPILIRDINVPEQYYKSELARKEAAETAFNEALRSGSDSEARKFEQLRPLLDRIRQMQESGQLESFESLQTIPSNVSLLANIAPKTVGQ